MRYLKNTFFLRWLGIVSIIVVLISACSGEKTGGDKKTPGKIPTLQQVGAPVMPGVIAKVTAPFEMPIFKKPVFPDYQVSITDFGAVEMDSVTKTYIQSAIDKVSGHGGGTVVVPPGKWFSGRIILKSNVNLHIKEGAKVYFSGKIEDYRPGVYTRIEGIEVMSLGACIYANGQDNIAITGKGKLIGPENGPVRKKILTTQLVDDVVPLDKPVSQRVFTGLTEDWIFPPMFISPIQCTNVYIQGISLENTAFWNIVPIYCEGVIIRGVTINSVGIQRGDGIDIESSRNVLIEYSTISSGDDCFTIKAGRGADGMRVNKPSENIVVRYCLARNGHGGITCGSETAGIIRNVYVHDCVFDNSTVGIRFKTRRPRGGGGENLYYKNIRMNLKATAFKWDMLGSTGSVGELANRLPKRDLNKLTPFYRNISATNLVIENCTHFLKVIGIPESPMTNLAIQHATVNCSNLIFAHDARNIHLNDITVHCRDSIIDMLDCRNVIFEHMNFNTPGSNIVFQVDGENSDSLFFWGSVPEKPVNWKSESWIK
jgi:hypothetical protein